MKQADNPSGRDRRRQKIELSTVLWYTDRLPAEVDIEACGLHGHGLPRGAFHAFYGVRGRQEGFIAARSQAAMTGRDYTAVDLSLQMDLELPVNRVSESDLQNLDFLPVHRLTQGLAETLDARVREILGRKTGYPTDGTTNALQETLLKQPRAVIALLDLPELQHVKAAAYLAKFSDRDDPVPVATIPMRHIGSIVDARSRLDPGLVIRLRQPGGAPSDAPEADDGHKPRGPRLR